MIGERGIPGGVLEGLLERVTEWEPNAGERVTSVLSVQRNPYSSRLDSYVLDVEMAHRRTGRILVKCGRVGESTRTGQEWGVARELRMYRGPLADLACYQSPFVGSISDGLYVLLGLRWFDALSVAKGPLPVAIEAAASWLGTFHRVMGGRLDVAIDAGLHRYGDGVVVRWAELATQTLGLSEAETSRLGEAAREWQQTLSSAETVVHGDFYPPNVLFHQDRVIPVDWEWSGVASGELDLAALLDGWDAPTVESCVALYRRARWPDGDVRAFVERLDAARSFLALRWLAANPAVMGDRNSEHRLRQIRSAAGIAIAPPFLAPVGEEVR